MFLYILLKKVYLHTKNIEFECTPRLAN